MNKAELKKGMLLKREEESGTYFYRVLELEEERILIMDCVKKTMPLWKRIEEFDSFEIIAENPVMDSMAALEDMSAEDRKIAYQRYNMVSAILPFLANEDMRTQAIKKVAKEYAVSTQTVRKYLCEYMASMDIRSLAPQERKVKKELTVDEKNMRKSLNRWFYNTKKRTLKNVYTLMLQHFYCDGEGIFL